VIAHIGRLDEEQKEELLFALTQVPTPTGADRNDRIKETLKRQLSLTGKDVDLAEGFRRRLVQVASLLEGHAVDEYAFEADRDIAIRVLEAVTTQAADIAGGRRAGIDEFAKTFRTMNRDQRLQWVGLAALAAQGKQVALSGQDVARPDATASRLATDVATAGAALTGAAGAGAAAGAAANAAAGVAGVNAALAGGAGLAGVAALAPLAGPIGLLAGGTLAYATLRKRKKEAVRANADAKRAAVENAQLRRQRQWTQAVVTTCAFLLATGA
jgi:hypothetical protein